MKKFIFISFVFFNTYLLQAQQTFNGTIEYTCTDTGKIAEMMMQYSPGKMYTAVSGNNVAQWFDKGIFALCKYIFIENQSELLITVDSVKKYTKVPYENGPFLKTHEKEDEIIEILGHQCHKYKVTIEREGTSNIHYIWITQDIIMPFSLLLEMYGNDQFEQTLPYAVLKIETVAGLTYEATKISTDIPIPSLFKLPKGYKEDKKMFRKAEEKKKK